MTKKILFFLIVGILVFNFSVVSWAQEESLGVKADVPETTEALNVGNKICPVSGEEINEETKVTYEYEGKIYNFCCPMCIEEFKKEPKEYIEKIEEELQAQAKEEPTLMLEQEMPGHMPGGHQHHH